MQATCPYWIALLLFSSIAVGCSNDQTESDGETAPAAQQQSEEAAPEGGPKMIPPTVGDDKG